MTARFGLFADAHYAEMVYGDRHCEESPAKLTACIDTFEQSELDFVVCMGDIIDESEDRDVELGYLVRMRGSSPALVAPGITSSAITTWQL